MSSAGGDPNSTPALAPPLGVEPNFVDPPSQAWITVIIMVVYLVVATPFVAARMYTRARVHKSLWWDDWTALIAWIGLVGFVSLTFISIRYGSGVDLWNVTQADAIRFKKTFANIEVTARISIFFTKLSILLLYLRYFCPQRTQRTWIFWTTWATIIFNFLYCVALVLMVLLQCVGKPHAEGASCVNSYLVLVTASVINIVTDLAVLAIPLFAVKNLRMARKKKIGLGFVFAMGGLAVLASAARLAYQIPEASNANQTMVLSNVVILALAEQVIGIVVGSMPILPSLYRHIRPRSTTGTDSSRTPTSKRYWRSASRDSPDSPRRQRRSELYQLPSEPATLVGSREAHDRDDGEIATAKGDARAGSTEAWLEEGRGKEGGGWPLRGPSVELTALPSPSRTQEKGG